MLDFDSFKIYSDDMAHKNIRERRIKVPNNLWWYGLIILLLSGIVGYFTYSKAVSLVPDLISTWQSDILQAWDTNMPGIVSKGSSAIVTALGAGLATYCFFFGLRCFIPPTVPTLTPKDYRNQPLLPELLRNGEIKTYIIPNSRLLKIFTRIVPSVRFLSKEPKLLVISNVSFLLKGGFIIGALLVLYYFRLEILSQIDAFGINTTGFFVPPVISLVWFIAATLLARILGVAALIKARKPDAKTLMNSAEYQFKGHPNIIYSAMQSAWEIIRKGEFPNRVHIDDSKLVPTKPPDAGVFSGTMLIESYPHYFSTAYVLAPAIFLASGVALVSFGFKHYFNTAYNISPMALMVFLKSELPLYIRDLFILIGCLGWGKALLLQALKLISHYRFYSNAILIDFSGSFVRSTAVQDADTSTKFNCRAEVILRSAEALSEAYQLWGQRELLSFQPNDATKEILERVVSGTKEELT